MMAAAPLGCKFMFDLSAKVAALTPQEARYVLDNCSNQYILNNAFLNTSLPHVEIGSFSKTRIFFGKNSYARPVGLRNVLQKDLFQNLLKTLELLTNL
jgi:hypothetical protein